VYFVFQVSITTNIPGVFVSKRFSDHALDIVIVDLLLLLMLTFGFKWRFNFRFVCFNDNFFRVVCDKPFVLKCLKCRTKFTISDT
jgi:hypothetical protein